MCDRAANCRNGDNCQFSHDDLELLQKPSSSKAVAVKMTNSDSLPPKAAMSAELLDHGSMKLPPNAAGVMNYLITGP